MMNKAIAREIQVTVQYMWQHVMAKGLNSAEIADVFEEIAISEMKHAEKIAERIFYFDVVPTTRPDPIKVGGSITEMLEADAKAEEEAIELYKEIIKLAQSEGDSTTRLLFEQIRRTEDHHDKFTTCWGGSIHSSPLFILKQKGPDRRGPFLLQHRCLSRHRDARAA
jgi:bacterioferritin